MARRRRKGKGRRGSRAIPLLSLMPVYPAVARVATEGSMAEKPKLLVYELTGYNMFTGGWEAPKAGRVLTLAIVGIVGHKMANKLGINKHVKKLTGGMLQL